MGSNSGGEQPLSDLTFKDITLYNLGRLFSLLFYLGRGRKRAMWKEEIVGDDHHLGTPHLILSVSQASNFASAAPTVINFPGLKLITRDDTLLKCIFQDNPQNSKYTIKMR